MAFSLQRRSDFPSRIKLFDGLFVFVRAQVPFSKFPAGSAASVYNVYVMCKVAGRPGWWLLLLLMLMLIPIVTFIAIILNVDISKRFGKGVGFAIGVILLPFIFWPILGFGSAQYEGAPPPPPMSV